MGLRLLILTNSNNNNKNPLGFDSSAENGEEFGEPGVERGPGRAGDEIAIHEGLVHGEIDVRAAGESHVRAGGWIGAALFSLQDPRGR